LAQAAADVIEESAPAPTRISVEMAEVPLDVFARYAADFGRWSTRLLPDGLAVDVISAQVGALHIEMTTPPRRATDEERSRLRLKLVEAAVGTEPPQ
jgi:hypothetical protein